MPCPTTIIGIFRICHHDEEFLENSRENGENPLIIDLKKQIHFEIMEEAYSFWKNEIPYLERKSSHSIFMRSHETVYPSPARKK
jgi:hypothetical protein